MTTPATLTKSRFAAHIGVAKSYVSKLGNTGRLVLTDDGLVRVPETLALLKASTGAPERANPAAVPDAIVDWRERKERAQAEMAEMDVAQRRGELMVAADVRAATVAAGTALRTRLELLPDQLAPQLAATADEQQVRSLLASEIEAALAEMAHQFAVLAEPVKPPAGGA